MSWLFKLAADSGVKGDKFARTAGTQSCLAWGRKNGLVSSDPQDMLKWKGALAIRTDPGGKTGHVALVLGRNTVKDEDGNLVITSIGTAEGNSNSNGSSNGDRAVFNIRTISSLNRGTWSYLDISKFAGGSYWP